jgi:uncharacterized protein YfkK (UPF0435 family)
MRTLSDEEKSFITELVRISSSSQNVFLGNIIDRELNGVDVYLDYANKKVEYRFDEGLYKQDPSQFMDFARVFSWKIMRYVTLLRDLEKEGMLFLYQESPNVPNSSFGRLVRGRIPISNGLNDTQAISSILEYTKKTILINQSLLDFESNDFKTEDALRHLESVEYSKKNLELADQSLKSSLVSLDLATKSLDASNKGLDFSKDNLDLANKSFNSGLESLDLATQSFKSGNTSLKYSRYTLIATISIFIVGTIINIIISNKDQQPLNLDETQLNMINKSIQTKNQKLLMKLDTISNVFGAIDSLVGGVKSEINGIENTLSTSNKTLTKQIESIDTKLKIINKTVTGIKFNAE